MSDQQDVSTYSQQLSDLGIENEVIAHPKFTDSNKLIRHLGISASDCCPTLIMKAGNKFIAIIRRGDTQLDLKALKKQLAVQNLRFATDKEFTEITKLQPGAARPLNFGLQTLLDHRLLEKEYVFGGSGSFSHTIKYAADDLTKIPSATFINRQIS
jgi:prolyl-tRNA editing enzyme YbaK/EbsC (Cys-tRNA(Pro) deacylase)